MIRILLSTLVFVFLAESVSAARLTNRDLRRFGFSGRYLGDVEGFVKTRDDNEFIQRRVSQQARETLPVRRQTVVTGPTRRNGFFLTLNRITGNQRRINVRMHYSGRSYNPVYEEEMVGGGTKILRVRKFATTSGPEYEMNLTDRFNERAMDGGGFYSTWNIRGRLFK